MKFAASILDRFSSTTEQEMDVFERRLESMTKPQAPHVRHRTAARPVLFGFRKEEAAV